MSYYYTYVPRFSGEVNKPPEKKEEANPNNPWLVPGPEKKMPPGFNPWLAPAPEKKVELKSHNPWLAPAPAIPAPAPAVASPAPVNWFQFQVAIPQTFTFCSRALIQNRAGCPDSIRYNRSAAATSSALLRVGSGSRTRQAQFLVRKHQRRG